MGGNATPAFRATRQREAVLAAVRASDQHPTAEDIHHAVQSTAPGLGVATVYRALDLLAAHGLVRELHLAGDPVARYDATVDDHQHVVCTNCGRAFDVAASLPPTLLRSAAEQSGVRVTSYELEFRGRCGDCGDTSLPDIRSDRG